ncbi:MAG: esterase-like activity of phytase family protein, partial [Methylococcales bacterium]
MTRHSFQAPRRIGFHLENEQKLCGLCAFAFKQSSGAGTIPYLTQSCAERSHRGHPDPFSTLSFVRSLSTTAFFNLTALRKMGAYFHSNVFIILSYRSVIMPMFFTIPSGVIMKKTLIPLLLLPIFGAPSAQAAVELIAIGRIDPSYQDLSTRTAGPLESGVPGNMLGSLGSGLAYAGDNIFIAIPDRGPNATPYDPAIDDTTSYINRFQTLNLSLAANPDYDSLVVGSLPYILSPFLTATTLLSSTLPLSYGVDGEPALNTVNKYYFTGRSDNFNPARQSINPFHGRFDPEGVRVSNDGKSVFISDEYGPYV